MPLKSVTTVSVAGEDPATFPIQVMVPTGSDIKSLADLAGKTVATASLFQLNDLALMESLNKAGVDASTVKFVEIPFPNMAEALSAGRAGFSARFAAISGRRAQPVSATPGGLSGAESSWSRASAGVFQLRRLRGRLLSSAAT